MKTLRLFLIAVTALAGIGFAQTATGAQQPLSDNDIALLRQDIQSAKTDVINKNMQFTQAQSAAFWPLYREYSNKQQIIGDKLVAVIKQYVRDYNSMNDKEASDLTDQMMKINQDGLDLRKEYFPKFEKALGGKTASKFYQVDNRIMLLLRLQTAANVPMIK